MRIVRFVLAAWLAGCGFSADSSVGAGALPDGHTTPPPDDDDGGLPSKDPGPAPQRCPPDRRCAFDMELGVGVEAFSLVVAGQEVPLTEGPQGGYHIWLAARCRDCPPQVLIEYGVRDTSGAWMWGQSLMGVVNLSEHGDWLEVVGLYGMMPGSPGEIDYLGDEVDLDVTIFSDVKPDDTTPRSSRVVRVKIGDIEVWDCVSSIPEECGD